MKKYFFILTFTGLLFFFACEKTDFQALEIKQIPVLVQPDSNNFVFSDETSEDTIVVLKWEEAEYNVATEVTYTIEMDAAGGDFSSPAIMGTTSTDSLAVTVFNFNKYMTLDFGLPIGTESQVDIRVGAQCGESELSYSDIISLSATTYDPPYTPDSLFIMSVDTKLKSLALLNDYLDEDGIYEGYVWLGAGNLSVTLKGGDEQARVFGYVSDSYNDQVTTYDLDQTGDPITVDSIGYYRFRVNLYDLSLEVMGTHWGVIGSAIPPYDWSVDVDMTYDQVNDLWTVQLTTDAAEFKFRPNDTWDPLNYGDDAPADGIPEEYGDNIPIDAGNKIITLDLSEFPYSYNEENAK
ncbi:MAG: SusE domain-containing protein [Bacteroidales bacterium]|nr:SusE domain-containing protein [Bacteroidales bacterium]